MLTLLHLPCIPWMNSIYLAGVHEEGTGTSHNSDTCKWQAGAFSVRSLSKFTSISDACLNTQTTVNGFFVKIKNTKIKRWLATSKKDHTKNLKSDVPVWAVACSFIFPMASECCLLPRDHRYECIFGLIR